MMDCDLEKWVKKAFLPQVALLVMVNPQQQEANKDNIYEQPHI